MENIKKVFQDKGVKPTYHRIKIMEYLANSKTHPTADKIYENIVRSIPTVSKTTVYNTLKIFVEKEMISELTITGSETHYDTLDEDHHHFYCMKCKQIYDMESACDYTCSKKEKIDGNEIHSYQCYYKGICKNCLKNTEEKENINN